MDNELGLVGLRLGCSLVLLAADRRSVPTSASIVSIDLLFNIGTLSDFVVQFIEAEAFGGDDELSVGQDEPGK